MMPHSDQTDSELRYDVVLLCGQFAVMHSASRIVVAACLGCLEATELAEELTEQAHADSEAILR